MRGHLFEQHELTAVGTLHAIVLSLKTKRIFWLLFFAAEAVFVLGCRLVLEHVYLCILVLISLSAAKLSETTRAVEVVLLVAAGGRRRVLSDPSSSKLIS